MSSNLNSLIFSFLDVQILKCHIFLLKQEWQVHLKVFCYLL